MTIFKPCIDLHQGKVKQIVGETLSFIDHSTLINFETDKPSAWFAELFKKDGLVGGHIIQLGSGNKEAAFSAMQSFPLGMQVGGGITPDNAESYLSAGASQVFPELRLDIERLQTISHLLGKGKLVLDISCRKGPDGWMIAKDKWQTVTVNLNIQLFSRAVHTSESPVCFAGIRHLKSGILLFPI